MDKLSIIIPIYNSELYIEELLKDILKIDIPNHEIILVNDGSNDNTKLIIENYSSRYSQIKVVNQINQGVSSARNHGLRKAVGDYIMFLDADDRLDPIKFTNFFNEAIKAGAQYNFTGYIENNFRTSKVKVVDSSGEGLYNLDDFMSVFFENLKKNLISYPINKIYLKSIIDKHDLKFDESVFFAEDLLFNLDYLMHVNTIYISKENYYIYQKYSNEKSLSSEFSMMFWTSRKLIYEKLNTFCGNISPQKYKKEINTYAANTMVYTITQVIETSVSFSKKLTFIRQIITDKYTQDLLCNEINFSKKQMYFIKAVHTKKPLLVYLVWKAYFLKLKMKKSRS